MRGTTIDSPRSRTYSIYSRRPCVGPGLQPTRPSCRATVWKPTVSRNYQNYRLKWLGLILNFTNYQPSNLKCTTNRWKLMIEPIVEQLVSAPSPAHCLCVHFVPWLVDQPLMLIRPRSRQPPNLAITLWALQYLGLHSIRDDRVHLCLLHQLINSKTQVQLSFDVQYHSASCIFLPDSSPLRSVTLCS